MLFLSQVGLMFEYFENLKSPVLNIVASKKENIEEYRIFHEYCYNKNRISIYSTFFLSKITLIIIG